MALCCLILARSCVLVLENRRSLLTIALGLFFVLLLLAFLYWLIVVGEGTYPFNRGEIRERSSPCE